MRKYTVSIPEVHNTYITIDMEDDATDEAIKDKANLLLESGDYCSLDALEYSHTMDMDMWDIIRLDGEKYEVFYKYNPNI